MAPQEHRLLPQASTNAGLGLQAEWSIQYYIGDRWLVLGDRWEFGGAAWSNPRVRRACDAMPFQIWSESDVVATSTHALTVRPHSHSKWNFAVEDYKAWLVDV